MNDIAYRELNPPSPYTGFDQMPIGGAWRRGSRQDALEDRNPYTGEVILEMPQASCEDMDQAYKAAAKAHIDGRRQPRWREPRSCAGQRR